MPATSFINGRDAILYWSATPDTALASLTLIADQIGDLEVDMGREGGTSIQSRASGGWAENSPGLRTLAISGSFVLKPTSDAFADALEDAYLGDDEMTFAALTGAKDAAGSRGPRFNATIENFKRNEPLSGAITCDFALSLSSFLQWHVISGS